MAKTWVNGFDGAITMPTIHGGSIRTWRGSFTRHSSVVTDFADTGVRRILGISDLTGEATGSPTFDAANQSPGVDDRVRAGSAITLTVATACSYQPTCVFQEIGFDVDKMGDSNLRFAFELSDGTAPVETWDVS